MNLNVNNQENFQTNSNAHSITVRNKHHVHIPNANLSCFQKSTFFAVIKIFNSLPHSVTCLKNELLVFKPLQPNDPHMGPTVRSFKLLKTP